jgi:DNA polymerase III subunit alpha
LLAYQTAYLKVHYPVEFMAAMLSSEAGNTEKVVKYINEARGLGIRVLPPCVQESGLYFTPVGDDIRFGLAAIKNVGENTAKAICDARADGVKFRDLFSFCESIEPRCLNKRVLESLVKSGALDCLGASRGRLFAAIDQAILRGQKKSQAKAVGQGGLFLSGSSSTHSQAVAWHESSLPEADDWTEEQLLAGEYATLGFYISGHPMDKYAGRLKDLNAVDLSTMETRRNGEDIVVAGIIVQSRPMRSRRGARWAILTLQDRTGVIEALVFPEAFQKLEAILKANTPLLAKGRVAVEDVGTRLIVSDARLLDQLTDRAPSLLRVRVDLGSVNAGALERLQELFTKRPGRCRVAFELVKPDGSEATLEAGSAVMADRDLLEQVREICGTDSVAVVQ